jgi:type IV pilus assembly protein PilQ
LIIKDIPKSIPAVKNLVKALDTKTPQVVIEARIVTAGLAFQRELGVRWGFLMDVGKAQLGGGVPGTALGSTVRDVVSLPAVPRSGLGALAATGATGGTAGILSFLLTNAGGLKSLDIELSAHENQGTAKIISSPKVATLDNKEASIEQGLRIPIPQYTTEGTISTTYVDALLKLVVTPHVTNDGNVKMIIKVNKDAPDFNNQVLGVPSIDKKAAITEVLVKDNGVVVIGGIYEIQKNDGSEGVPLLNKIPLLGWLFKRENKEDQRKDLLIFISPKILKDEV